MITRILLAIDSTTRASAALAMATAIAERFDARMWLLRVIAVPSDYPYNAHVDDDDPLPAYLKMEARTQIEELAFGNPRALTEPPIIVIGAAAPAILDTARNLSVDLIVVGCHRVCSLGYSPSATIEGVAGRGHCSVLLVNDA